VCACARVRVCRKQNSCEILGFCHSVTLRSVNRQFVSDVSGQRVAPIFRGQDAQEDILTPEHGTDRLPRNAGDKRTYVSQQPITAKTTTSLVAKLHLPLAIPKSTDLYYAQLQNNNEPLTEVQ